MRKHLTVDPAGRVVLPKAVRDQLHLAAGDVLDFAVDGEEIRLRPRRSANPLQKERGVWVFRTGNRLTAAEADHALENVRLMRSWHGGGDTA